MKRGRLWRGRCRACGVKDDRTWPYRPGAPACRSCGEPLALSQTPPVRYSLPHISRPSRMSRKGFTPGWSSAFGCDVESPEHMRHLQKKNGTEDADPRDKDNIPRDLERIAGELW